jgi:hypothetical protein
VRGRGTGLFAVAIELVFTSTVKRLGLNAERREAKHTFVRPAKATPQLSLF